jgi:hypothetical protein
MSRCNSITVAAATAVMLACTLGAGAARAEEAV